MGIGRMDRASYLNNTSIFAFGALRRQKLRCLTLYNPYTAYSAPRFFLALHPNAKILNTLARDGDMSFFGSKQKKAHDFPEEQTGVAEPLVSIEVMPEINERDEAGSPGTASFGATGATKSGTPALPGSDKTTGTGGLLKNKKVLIILGAVVMIFFIVGVSWFYIQSAQQEQLAARRSAPVSQGTPPQPSDTAPEPQPQQPTIPPTSTTTTPSLPPTLPGTIATTTQAATTTPQAPTRPSDALTFLDTREYTLGPDVDGDQLSDVEETWYGTQIASPDSDADTFPDGWEIVNLYNPALADGARLIDAPTLDIFKNTTYGYELMVLKGLTLATVDPLDPKEITLTAPSTELMRIMVEPNPYQLNIRAWLEAKYGPSARRILLNRFTTKRGISGWMTTDGLTKYFVGRTGVFVWRYEFGTSPTVNFRQTWDMMSSGFVFDEPVGLLNNAPPVVITTSTPEGTAATSTPAAEPAL